MDDTKPTDGGAGTQEGVQTAVLAAVVASSLDGIIIVDTAGVVVEFNPAAEQIFGYSRDAAIGRSIGALIVPPHLRGAHEQGMARYLGSGAAHVLGKRIQIDGMRSDGTIIPVELSITEIKTAGTHLFAASLRELSAHRAAQAALAQSNARLTAFLDYAPAAMYLKSREGRYLVANKFMAAALGRPLNEIVGHHVDEILAPSALAQVAISDQRILSTGAPYVSEERFEVRGGYRDTMSVRFPVRDAEGEISHLGGVLIDITERREAEEMLRALSEQHPVALVIMRRDDHAIIRANPAFDTLVGEPLAGGDCAGGGCDGWLARVSGRDDLIGRMKAEASADGFETQLRRGDASLWVSISWRQTALSGAPVLLVVVIDIDARKAAEAELERHRDALHQAEKLTALGSMLAGVSHELNNPLSAVVGQSLMLEEDCAGTPHAARVAKIRTAAERCARIVQTFLAMARQKKPERLAVAVERVVAAAVDLSDYGMRTAGISVEVDYTPGLPQVTASSDQIHQVFVNLLINAQQALQGQDGPRLIRVRTRPGSRPGMVAVEISDNGPGVPPEVRSRIFDPFFTTKANAMGTGLGLSFSRGIVEAHGGTLSLLRNEAGVSSEGRGATFVVELPVHAGAEREAEAPAAVAAQGGGRVLVVDDEPSVGETLGEILTRQGFLVDVAGSSAQAQVLLGQQVYRLILSDLRMPGMDGPALYGWLCAHLPEMADKVGFVTGDTLGDAAASFLAKAGRPYLEKPFTPAGVRAIVAELTQG